MWPTVAALSYVIDNAEEMRVVYEVIGGFRYVGVATHCHVVQYLNLPTKLHGGCVSLNPL